MKKNIANGAYEEPHVFGKRIEICGNKLIILWRNKPVLETTFEVLDTDNNSKLILKDNALRYGPNVKPYAFVDKILYENETIEITENFPISGLSITKLSLIDYPRYGNYDIVDSLLKDLEGEWIDNRGFYVLVFNKNQLSSKNDNRTINIHVLKHRKSFDHIYKIVNEDASITGVFDLEELKYDGEKLTGFIHVYDAPSLDLEFKKRKK